MIVSFFDKGTEDVFNGVKSRVARQLCPPTVMAVALRKLDALNAAMRLSDLKSPPGNKLKSLDADGAGQHSIRINEQYRVCFVWTTDGPTRVEINKHYR